MDMYIYNCLDSVNTINKTKTDEEIRSIILKDKTNLINPIIRLKSKTLIEKNYCYIPSLKRYYFIEDINFISNDIQEVYLKCDVLETFKDDILNSNCNIVKSEEDNYLSNGRMNEEIRVSNIYEGDPIDYKDNVILVTIK